VTSLRAGATLAVAAVLLAGCHSAPPPADPDPVGSIEATISSVESGFAADAGADAGAAR
jgi:hypothetical protein